MYSFAVHGPKKVRTPVRVLHRTLRVIVLTSHGISLVVIGARVPRTATATAIRAYFQSRNNSARVRQSL